MLTASAYSAFNTNISLKAKSNIEDVKAKVDSLVPKDGLLFWGETDNPDNSLTTLKDKSGKENNGTLNGFENTESSGYNSGELVFDGTNDYVDIGLSNYDFKNSQSYVICLKMNTLDKHQIIFGNWYGSTAYTGGGGGIYFNKSNELIYDIYNKMKWYAGGTSKNFKFTKDKYYALIATYDGNTSKLYIDGELIDSRENIESLTEATNTVKIGVYYMDINRLTSFASMNLKEALLYDRALTDKEVKSLTKGFEAKYKI